MVSYKLDKYDKYFVAFILVILVIFNIGSCFASETESVNLDTIQNVVAVANSNAFVSTSGNSSLYFLAEKGYRYNINVVNSFQNSRLVVTSSAMPSVNVEYNILYYLQNEGDNYVFNSYSDQYITISSNVPSGYIVVTRERIENMNGAIGDLVSNVGPQQLWGVFESGIDFIGVVVLVAFGLFLIVLLIKKLSKGKSDF